MEVTVSFCLNPQGLRGYRRVVIFDGNICQVLAQEKFADRVSSIHPFFTTASPVFSARKSKLESTTSPCDCKKVQSYRHFREAATTDSLQRGVTLESVPKFGITI